MTAERTPIEPPTRASVGYNAWLLGVGTIAARVAMFGLGIVLARSLGPGGYGTYSLALAIGFVLQPIADLGLTPYLARETARSRTATEAALPTIMAAKTAVIALTYAVTLVVTAVSVDDAELFAVIAVLVFSTLIDGYSGIGYAYFQGRESMAFEAKLTATMAIVRALGAATLAVTFERLGPVVAWTLLVALVQATLTLRRLGDSVEGRHLLRPRRRSAPVHWRSVAAMGLMAIFVTAYLRIDSVLLGVLVDEEAVGIYAAAYTLMMGAQIAPTMLATALTPVFARTHGREPAEFERSWHDGVQSALLIAMPIALVTSLLAGPIIDRFYGAEFADAAEVLAIIIWICPLGALSLVAQAVLRGARREAWLTSVSGGCAALNLIANLWAIPRYGVLGASWVTVATEAANVIVLAALVIHLGLVPRPVFPWLRAGLALLALTVAAVTLGDVLVELGVAAGLAAYAAVLIATGASGGIERSVLARVTRRR